MSIFDRVKDIVASEINYAVKKGINDTVKDINKTVKDGVDKGINKIVNRSERFTFAALPTTVEELKNMPEASLDTAFKTAALTMAVLCNFDKDPEMTYKMLDFLKGPEPTNPSEKAMIKERLDGKQYKAFSFFAGATVQNNYKPSTPFTITISENSNSFNEENWAVLYVNSAGADNPRPIKFRKKPSTGQWFLNDIQCLADIRIPAASDPWA